MRARCVRAGDYTASRPTSRCSPCLVLLAPAFACTIYSTCMYVKNIAVNSTKANSKKKNNNKNIAPSHRKCRRTFGHSRRVIVNDHAPDEELIFQIPASKCVGVQRYSHVNICLEMASGLQTARLWQVQKNRQPSYTSSSLTAQQLSQGSGNSHM